MTLTQDMVKDYKNAFGYVDLEGSGITSLADGLFIDCTLAWMNSEINSIGNNITIKGCLDLEGSNIGLIGRNLTVGSDLYLRRAKITQWLGGLTVSGDLGVRDTNITQLPENSIIGGSVDLKGSEIAQLPEDFVVCGSLNLEGTNIAQLPNNLTVRGYLDVSDTKITNLPSSLIVSGVIYLVDTNIDRKQAERVKKLKYGEYVPSKYLYADGILTHIKSRKELGTEYVYYKGRIKGKNVLFDGYSYAHCETIKEGIADLTFKSMSSRGAYQYKGLDKNKQMAIEEAMTMYRIITGACKQGTDDFAGRNKHLKTVSVNDIIDITKGHYGHNTFIRFFGE